MSLHKVDLPLCDQYLTSIIGLSQLRKETSILPDSGNTPMMDSSLVYVGVEKMVCKVNNTGENKYNEIWLNNDQ